ncbi:MAG TPA: DUF3108 domain-containing protein [Thermoanaerobaculia bacterium]|nr:DUF3108 domain-containing protein [Thermoanaerobaculia bacterium]
MRRRRSHHQPPRRAARGGSRLATCRPAIALAMAVACAGPAIAHEELEYGWKLKGFSGVLIGLFYPDSGEARITTEEGPGTRYTTTLELTSRQREGAYYRYGSEIGSEGSPVRVWSAYQFRGKSKAREQEVDEHDVLDFPSAIQTLRRERPMEERWIRLWSDGNEYPLTVSPDGVEEIDCNGHTWTTRRYVIEGRRVKGERYWKGRFQLWLADDKDATPVRIVGERGLLTVRLELVDVARDEEFHRRRRQAAAGEARGGSSVP